VEEADPSSTVSFIETPASTKRGLREKLRSWLTTVSDGLVSTIFPADCRICGEPLVDSRRAPICPKCLDSFGRIPANICEICGCPLFGLRPNEELPRLCPACQNRTYRFDWARSFAIYQGALVRAILLLKFEQIEPLGAWFAEKLAEVLGSGRDRFSADVVVPVPLHRQRERERGYNQAALISKPLARHLRLPHKALLLMRTKVRA
jgi:predicted amidophosphoribosyltransferase